MILSQRLRKLHSFSPQSFLSGLDNFCWSLSSRSFVIFLLQLSISSKFLFQILNFFSSKISFFFFCYISYLSAEISHFFIHCEHILPYLTEYNYSCFKVLSVSIFGSYKGWSQLIFISFVDHIFLILDMSSNFGSYPRHCKCFTLERKNVLCLLFIAFSDSFCCYCHCFLKV